MTTKRFLLNSILSLSLSFICLSGQAEAQKYSASPQVYKSSSTAQTPPPQDTPAPAPAPAVFDPADLSADQIELMLQREGPADLQDARAVLNSVCDPNASGYYRQISPGIRAYRYHKHKVMALCIGIGAKTWIEFPKWEKIRNVKPVLGDTQIFGTVEHDDHSVVLHAMNYGVDSTLHVRGAQGDLYTFFVKSVGTDYKAIPDASVFVYAEEPYIVPSEPSNAAQGGQGTSASSSSATRTPSEDLEDLKRDYTQRRKPEYKRRKPFNWNRADCNRYDVWAQNEAGEELMPERICTDGFWTLFDFGDKVDRKRRPLVHQVTDGTDKPMQLQTRGDRDQLLLVPRTGRFTIGIGDAIICAVMIARDDSYKDHPNG